MVLFISALGIFALADGHADAFYLKFTSPKQHSLIIGSSRAAQGIQPRICNALLPGVKLYNYAFSRIHTPYGEPYLLSIKRKLDPESHNGVFVLEVNPWTISDTREERTDGGYFRESESVLGKVKYVNMAPNIPYLLYCYTGRNIELITKKWPNYHGENLEVRDDGWFEVALKDDQHRKEQRVKATLNSYREMREEYLGASKRRLEYLKTIIEYLKRHGTVLLLRMPVDKAMREMEHEWMPNFDIKMEKLAKETRVEYWNAALQHQEYEYTDGHHLSISSGEEFSKELAKFILQCLEQNKK
ncbi:hypothetical protein [Mangrovimonas sp. DI 80]|uniref:hypothetical protein n=1 Tax=Mangrovimonas sp. DI 80 TaxID=1779330 RepID=UPI000F504D54|nr:hypothetical protein [Mangrovimonas sp. DI 80]